MHLTYNNYWGNIMTTLKDVAREAGVNISTASRALNGSKSISVKTASLIKQVAKELNYTPNTNAQILAGKSSHMIGIIVPEINSDYFGKMINTLEAQLQEHEYHLIIANTQYQPYKEAKAIENFVNYNIDGVFLACNVNVSELSNYQQILNANNIPLIALDVRQQGAECNQIMVDDVAGLTMAIRHLIEKGHHHIGFLGDHILDATMRSSMFKQALIRNGLDPDKNPIYSHPSARFEKAGYDGMNYFLSLDSYPTAYIAGYDDVAIGAMRAIDEFNLRIPDDIAIIGNDNGRASDYLHKRLTTLSPPVERMAEIGVDFMINCIKEQEKDIIHHISLKPEFLIRETT